MKSSEILREAKQYLLKPEDAEEYVDCTDNYRTDTKFESISAHICGALDITGDVSYLNYLAKKDTTETLISGKLAILKSHTDDMDKIHTIKNLISQRLADYRYISGYIMNIFKIEDQDIFDNIDIKIAWIKRMQQYRLDWMEHLAKEFEDKGD